MVSTRMSLLLLCFALATHHIHACDLLDKGDLTGDSRVYFTMLQAYQPELRIDVSPGGLGRGIKGVHVFVCAVDFPSPVAIFYYDSKVIARRTHLSDQKGTLEFIVVVHYDYITHKSKLLENGYIGSATGKSDIAGSVDVVKP